MRTIRRGLIKRIHVDKQVIARNRKLGLSDPAITIQTSKGPKKVRMACNRRTVNIYPGCHAA
jgi:hypothetical protein